MLSSNDEPGTATSTAQRSGRPAFLYLILSGCVVMTVLFLTYGYENTWHLWNIPTAFPYFADARVLTAGSESHALGFDPLISNPQDPWGRPMNYPRIWQLLFFFGLDQSYTLYVGLTFAVLFFIGSFLITKDIDRPTALLITCAVFSPAVLLGLERANVDLVAFFLLALAVYVVNKSRLGTATIIGFSFLLKLYPIFAVAIFVRERKKTFLTIVAVVVMACGIYTLLMLDELKLIRDATPKPTHLAYGLDVVWMQIGDATGSLKAALAVRIVSLATALGAAAFSLFQAGRRMGTADTDYDHIDSFRVGAAVYVGSFLLGGNWDYRLMFLLFVMPQLMDWRRSPDGDIRFVALVTLICAMISMWTMLIGGLFLHFSAGAFAYFLLESVSNWMTFFGLLYLLLCSCPEWLKSTIPFGRARSG